MAISSNGKPDIHSGQQLFSNQAKSDSHSSNGKSDSVLLTVSIEVPKGQEPEKIEFQGNGRTVLLANKSQSNDNSKTDSVLVKISIEMPNEQELKKHDLQSNQATALVANGHQSNFNGHDNGNNGNQGSSSNGNLAMVNTAPEVKVEPPQVQPSKKENQDNSNGGSEGTANTIPLPNGGNIQLPDEAESIATPPDAEKPQFDKTIINETLQLSRKAITDRIMKFIDFKRDISGGYAQLYEMLKDYPFRKGKMLRPTMCISAARAIGGMGDRALTTAAALELYHNAFLIHDDIEDGSESRRGKETLHHAIGIARAINVGDATNVLAVGLLLENLSAIGIQKTLSVLHEIEFMAQQSVEGQAMELDWVANNTGHLTDQDYFIMCVKKTCWYTFMTPLRIGLIIGHPTANLSELVQPLADITRFGMILGIAFQIQDDLLNILGDLKTYGKEIGGDIYEGKRTIMLNHVIANSNAADRILEILALPREQKTPEQIGFILEEMKRCGSIEHGWYLARTLANQADNIFESMDFLKPESPLQPGENWGSSLQDRRFLKQLINYVIYRNL
ncbi:polyprenyl synthetase family protein [Dapis sp. BLCC M126]|uniref:polyprenyl synthetase family protein n=1 Tax=Dapis sp. BLCC M126 TaxID=3400189 RepID=UPI003CF07A21